MRIAFVSLFRFFHRHGRRRRVQRGRACAIAAARGRAGPCAHHPRGAERGRADRRGGARAGRNRPAGARASTERPARADQFPRQGDTLAITRLVLSGERMSNRREACRVEVEGGPFAASPMGRHEGLKRYAIKIPACPFTFVVLDAAILATVAEGANPAQPPASTRPDNRAGNTAGMCSFTQADCVVHIGGVWGPAGSSIPKGEIENILKARGASEKNALANYRALVSQATGDRQKVRAIAAEQASFSSKRPSNALTTTARTCTASAPPG